MGSRGCPCPSAPRSKIQWHSMPCKPSRYVVAVVFGYLVRTDSPFEGLQGLKGV